MREEKVGNETTKVVAEGDLIRISKSYVLY